MRKRTPITALTRLEQRYQEMKKLFAPRIVLMRDNDVYKAVHIDAVTLEDRLGLRIAMVGEMPVAEIAVSELGVMLKILVAYELRVIITDEV